MDGAFSTTTSSSSSENPKRRQRHDKPYRGIRMRKWGKWVAEVREPNKRSRIWLGSFNSAVAAARASDAAVFYLRGPTATFNFPECVFEDVAGQPPSGELSAEEIRKKAAEVGHRVDALEREGFARAGSEGGGCVRRALDKPDLNEYPPSSESSEDN